MADAHGNFLVKWGYCHEKELQALGETDGEDYVELAVALCKVNLPLFDVLFMGKQPAPHIPKAWALMKDSPRNLIEWPRDHGKTQFNVTTRNVHRIAYATLGIGTNPRILLVSETATTAEKNLLDIRSRLEGAYRGDEPANLLGAAFGDFSKRLIKSQPERFWMDLGMGVERDPLIEAVGLTGSITGNHPSDVNPDDVDSYESCRTAASQETRWENWTRTLENLFSVGTTVNFTCTPKAEGDIRGRAKATGKYRSIYMPALNRWPEETDYEPVFDANGTRTWVKLTPRGLGQVDGVEPLTALWPCPQGECPGPKCAAGELPGIPLHRPVNYLIHEKLIGSPFSFATEQMLKARASDEVPIKPHMLRFYSFDPADVGRRTEWNQEPIVLFPKDDLQDAVHAYDHAISQSRRADYTALARLYRDSQNRIFAWVSAGRWDPETVKRQMESQWLTDPHRRPRSVVSEGISFAAMFADDVQRTSNGIVPLTVVKRPTDKMTALVESGLLAHIYNGRFYFHHEDRDTINEFLNFGGAGGGSGFHDDRVDACRLAFGEIAQSRFIEAGISRPSSLRRRGLGI